MGLMDNFTSDKPVEVKQPDYFRMMKEAAKAELLLNAVKCGVPTFYINAMVTGKMELPEFAEELSVEMEAEEPEAIMKKTKARKHKISMDKLKEEIANAANNELNRANEKFPLFHSEHEGFSVIREELEESKEAMEELESSLMCLWDCVRGKETPYFLENTKPLSIADIALNLACEAVQTAAMLMKYEMSLEHRERKGEDE